MENIISVRDLEKSYGNHKAVNKISFDVYQGQLFSFLGVNGAGKSTTIDMITTVLQQDSGTITVNGNTVVLMI